MALSDTLASVSRPIQLSFNLSASLFHSHTHTHNVTHRLKHNAGLHFYYNTHTHTLALPVSMLRSGFIQLLLLFSDRALAKVDKFENCFAALIPKYLDNRSRQCAALKPASVFSTTRIWRPAPRSHRQQLKLSVSAQENLCQNLIKKTFDLRFSCESVLILYLYVVFSSAQNKTRVILCFCVTSRVEWTSLSR